MFFSSIFLLFVVVVGAASGEVLKQLCLPATISGTRCYKTLSPLQRTELKSECTAVSGVPISLGTIQDANEFIGAMKNAQVYGIWIDAKKVGSVYQWVNGAPAPGPLKWCKGSTKTLENLVVLCPFPDYAKFSATTCCVSDREDITDFAATCLVENVNPSIPTTTAAVTIPVGVTTAIPPTGEPTTAAVVTEPASVTTAAAVTIPVGVTTAIPPTGEPTTAAAVTEPATLPVIPATDAFNSEGLATTNAARVRHGVGALTLDEDLRKQAQEWADKLAADDAGLNHRPSNPNGENIAFGNPKLSVTDAIDLWYKEIDNYDFNLNNAKAGKTFGDIGHFTQLVWDATKRVGFGTATSARGNVFVVANYAPPGNVNVPTGFIANVKPLV